MPINTVQEFVRGQLDGTTSPYMRPARAYVKPPIPGTLATPQIFVWGSTVEERRQTAPRAGSSGGFKILDYDLSIWVYAIGNSGNKTLSQAWPTYVDAVADVLRAVTMPQQLTDPTTGLVTWLIEIAEQLSYRIAPVMTLRSQRLVRYAAELTCDVKEQVQG